MLTKAIIRKLNSDSDNHFKVYIPLLQKANNTEEEATLDATLIYIRGLENTFKVGDTVFVDFENGQYNRPVILGLLYLGKEDPDSINTNATFKSMQTLESTKLTENTIIGDLNITNINKKINNLLDKTDNNLKAKDIICDSTLLESSDIQSALDELAGKLNK